MLSYSLLLSLVATTALGASCRVPTPAPPAQDFVPQPMSDAPKDLKFVTVSIHFGALEGQCLAGGNVTGPDQHGNWPGDHLQITKCMGATKDTFQRYTKDGDLTKTQIVVNNNYICIDAGVSPKAGDQPSFDNCSADRAAAQHWDVSTAGAVKLAAQPTLCLTYDAPTKQIQLKDCKEGDSNQSFTLTEKGAKKSRRWRA